MSDGPRHPRREPADTPDTRRQASEQPRHRRPKPANTPGGLSALNHAETEEAAAAVRDVCAADSYVKALVERRPFASADDLYAASDAAVAGLDAHDLSVALAGHARIGEARDDEQSRREQAGTAGATEDVRAALRAANHCYEERFGHVFLIRASGRSAEEMLGALRARLANDPITERETVREELRGINRIRLARLVGG